MSSAIAWLDRDEFHRRQMREAIQMFREEGAVDELGLGRIRDVFSDRLFPGTSVLWRRARYLLFVPWIYVRLEQGHGRGSAEDRCEQLQRQLAAALRSSEGSGEGVIGASGADVKQPPDVILWAALRAFDVRVDPGRMQQVRAESVARSLRQRHVEEDEAPVGDVWHPRAVQLLPGDFPRSASFGLTQDEAAFLTELVLAVDAVPGTRGARRADSMLPVLLRDGVPDNIDLPWAHSMPSASPALRNAVHHAGCFSDLVDGARILYAKLVAQSRKDDDLEAEAEQALSGWSIVDDAERAAEVATWAEGLADLWNVVHGVNPRVGPAERRFVSDWARIALVDPAGVGASPEARQLVIGRENEVKGAKRARLAADGSIGRDASAVVPDRLTFRWRQASSIARDILAVGS